MTHLGIVTWNRRRRRRAVRRAPSGRSVSPCRGLAYAWPPTECAPPRGVSSSARPAIRQAFGDTGCARKAVIFSMSEWSISDSICCSRRLVALAHSASTVSHWPVRKVW